jgi:alanine-synthesizing transaminase
MRGPQDCVAETVNTYRARRDVLVDGLNRIGWPCDKPRATMFVWARIPDGHRAMGSLEFCKFVLRESKVALSPGIGFGPRGDRYVRFALVENQKRTRQALQGLRRIL